LEVWYTRNYGVRFSRFLSYKLNNYLELFYLNPIYLTAPTVDANGKLGRPNPTLAWVGEQGSPLIFEKWA